MYGSCLDLIIKEILEVIGGNLNMDWVLNDIRVLFFFNFVRFISGIWLNKRNSL